RRGAGGPGAEAGRRGPVGADGGGVVVVTIGLGTEMEMRGEATGGVVAVVALAGTAALAAGRAGLQARGAGRWGGSCCRLAWARRPSSGAKAERAAGSREDWSRANSRVASSPNL